MPTAVVLLPSTTYRAADFVRAAEGLGIDLIVASDNPPPFDMGDRYVQVDCSQPDRAAETLIRVGEQSPIDGIVAADDAGVVVAALTAQKLGLPANTPDAAEATRDKSLQRAAMLAAEIPQPRFVVVEPDDPEGEASATVGYPLVVKPLDRSAGQGVIRVNRPSDLARVLARVRSIVGASAPLLFEELMEGEEVALEGMVRDGELTTLAIFDKPDAAKGPFFPETILVTPTSLGQEVQTECERVAAAALRAIGITHGPVHVEMMVEGKKVRVIEVAARSIGGLCSRSLNFGLLETTLEALILRNAMGMEKPELRREQAASGVLMIPTPKRGRFVTVQGLEQVRRMEHISAVDMTTTVGSLVDPAPEGDRYLGFIFARARERAPVVTALRAALDLIEVVVE